MKSEGLAQTPPMGWNSWDVFGWAVTERQVLETAEVMVDRLLPFGWDTVVVDGGWMFPSDRSWMRPSPLDGMDGFGRYRPDPGRFPSAAKDRSFRPLADRLHAMGLKFGLHFMRGVPRAAADAGLPVLGGAGTCDEIADRQSLCTWSDMNYGVRAGLPAGQAYYDSVFALAAEWGVDYLKVDDIASPYHSQEVAAVASAVAKAGRPTVLSLSPGNATPLDALDHLRTHAHLWRISADFWDFWEDLRTAFDLLARWAPEARPGAWPDADMLPIGLVSIVGNERGRSVRWSEFTPDEVRTMLVLWCIARSPLMLGGHLSTLPEDLFTLLKHPDLLSMQRDGEHPRETGRNGNVITWQTRVGRTVYEAWFNVGETPVPAPEGATVNLGLSLSDAIPPHGVRLLKRETL